MFSVSAPTVSAGGAERCLPGRSLPFAGRDDIAHQAFVDVRWIDGRPRERFTNGDGSKLRRGEAFQRAKELAGGGTCGGEKDRLLHLNIGCRTAGSGGRARQRADDALAEHALKAPEDERLRPLDLESTAARRSRQRSRPPVDAGRPAIAGPTETRQPNCTFSGVKGWFRRSAGSTRSAREPEESID